MCSPRTGDFKVQIMKKMSFCLKTLLFKSNAHLLTILLLSTVLSMVPLTTKSEIAEASSAHSRIFVNEEYLEELLIIQENTIKSLSSPINSTDVARTMNVIVTGYSSTPEQTDSTPFITASGSRVRDGIVATNLLPFGTKIRIPEIYGDKIFTVEDRMHSRKTVNVDIWFASYWEAKTFGITDSYIEVLN